MDDRISAHLRPVGFGREIVDENDERDVEQGRGGPRRQHHVRCIIDARLTAPKLLERPKEK